MDLDRENTRGFYKLSRIEIVTADISWFIDHYIAPFSATHCFVHEQFEKKVSYEN